MSSEWRLSVVAHVYKNKGDVQSCSNYHGIKLLSHTMILGMSSELLSVGLELLVPFQQINLVLYMEGQPLRRFISFVSYEEISRAS